MRGKDTPLSEMIESFLMAKEAEGRSKRTIEQYTTYLGNFERWVGGGTVLKLTPEAATRYIAERRRRSPTIGRLSAAILSPSRRGSRRWATSQRPSAGRCSRR